MILTTQCNAVTTHKELSREPPHIDIVVLETVDIGVKSRDFDIFSSQ